MRPPPTSRLIFFIFMQFSGEIGQIIGWRPPFFGVGAPREIVDPSLEAAAITWKTYLYNIQIPIMIVLVNFDIYLHFFQRRVVVRPRPVVVAPRRPYVPVVPMAATAAVVGMAAGAAASSNRNSQPQTVIIKVTYSWPF